MSSRAAIPRVLGVVFGRDGVAPRDRRVVILVHVVFPRFANDNAGIRRVVSTCGSGQLPRLLRAGWRRDVHPP
ncbi:MAG: hypothetical protein C4346_14405 [Chloroflexota bacterium]